MKKLFLIVIIISAICNARTITGVKDVNGNIVHTMQSSWVIVESENSADTQTDVLSETERTKKIVDALIAANASNEAYISIFVTPATWNGVRFRGIGITENGTLTHQVYLGTLGDGDDCELSYAGQLAWVIGTQTSTYHQITFTSGGPYIPQPGDIFTGNLSDETAVVVSISALSSGSWAAYDAAGTITYRSSSGTFTNSETVTAGDGGREKDDVLTHAASDLLAFELADTLVVTAKAWGSTWGVLSPTDDTNAEGELDIKGSDFMVIVTTTCSADGKLLIKGY